MATTPTSSGAVPDVLNSSAHGLVMERYLSPGDMIDKFNPERLHPHGRDAAAIGADAAESGLFYVFFTRPDINIANEKRVANVLGIGDPTAPRELAKLLTGGTGLIPLLTNCAENYSAQDLVMDTHTVGEGWDGARITMPRATLNSRQDGTLQIEFQEWTGLPVTLLTKIWVDYIDAVVKGLLPPNLDAGKNYIQRRVLDYACSIYCFQMRPDGREIQFGVKYTGCFPTAVPFSPFSGRIGASEGIKVTVPFAYSFMEPMDAAIFKDFEVNAAASGVILRKGKMGKESNRTTFSLEFQNSKSIANVSGI